MTESDENLLDGYTVRTMDFEELEPLLREHHPRVFSRRLDFDLDAALGAEEKAAIEALRNRLGSPFRLAVGVHRGDELVGWSFGVQESPERFYMINAGVLPEHQGRGIYSALLPRLLERIRAEGFQVAYSRHAATNNRVLVPKLRAGFVITGLEVSDRFGTLVHLSYHFNQLRRRVLDFRCGESVPDAELRRYLRLE
jgi:ribosomal protein S18 acetylase RimI-like enzyme